MEFLDARRLTGPSLLFDGPAAILDVGMDHDDVPEFRRRWEAAVRRMASETAQNILDFIDGRLEDERIFNREGLAQHGHR